MSRARQVSENQCNACMPLGGVIAFKGVENAMVLVHGSQGCSTYMRLASCEHFNEPVDVASSSMNEKQTILGGEANLRKAMDNVIRVYNPGILGIVTTCLAETIGEDLDGIVAAYRRDRDVDVDIIPVSTPSFAGTPAEGLWAATRALVSHYARPAGKHPGVNVIVPHISPADIREIKRIFGLMGVEYTLLPDYSMTLDRPYGEDYRKIAPGGTRAEAISRMAGARATIQFDVACPDQLSPGGYLEREYGVPLVRLPLPIGLGNTDRLVEELQRLGGRALPGPLRDERGWLMDAMADAHKYSAEARPAIYGEPDLVYAFAGACAENGACPAVVATGSRGGQLATAIRRLLEGAECEPVILEESDFSAIENAAVEKGVNVAIGHSGGKFLSERRGIPIVRMGFPIHDRIGGQRILSAGYAGTLAFLDRLTNALLERKHASYRRMGKADRPQEE